MPVINQRAYLVGLIAAGLYALIGFCLFVWHRVHPLGRGYAVIGPYIFTAPWSGLIRTDLGMLVGLGLNSTMIYFVAAGMYMAIKNPD